MGKKRGEGGHGQETYDLKNGQYVKDTSSNSEKEKKVEDNSIKGMNLEIKGKGDLEMISRKIIEKRKPEIIKKAKKLLGLEELIDIQPNLRSNLKEINDDNHGIDYYLIISDDEKYSGVDDKTGCNTRNFSFEIFKNINGKPMNAWFTNKYKRNDFLLFGNLVAEHDIVQKCEYDLFDMSGLAYSVYSVLGLNDPDINPDSFLYRLGMNACNNYKGRGKNSYTRVYMDKNGKPVEGAYVRIKTKPDDKRGYTVSVSIEIEKDKIRKMLENDEHQFFTLK